MEMVLKLKLGRHEVVDMAKEVEKQEGRKISLISRHAFIKSDTNFHHNEHCNLTIFLPLN